ncbi:hypothetical protein Syun_019469 [Stephania yunnanensis]|uniref:WDR11 second beta-propeller domain-containing protein n=1 Tax=Stephania yunnanensis TaxID=152371 RepID=A0AAP0NVY3_9MAGN
MKDCYMIVSLIAVIDVSAHAFPASFCVHNGIVRGFRWLSNSRLVSFSYTQKEMQKFTAKIVDMMKQEKLYASQGGPIILSQASRYARLQFQSMNQQEEGWPLGLQPLNMRVGLVRTRDFSRSISFNTLITGSPSSSNDSSSDLDTEVLQALFNLCKINKSRQVQAAEFKDFATILLLYMFSQSRPGLRFFGETSSAIFYVGADLFSGAI